MEQTIKIEDTFTPQQLINYLLEVEKKLASLGMSLKEAEYSMCGDLLIDCSQHIDEAVELIKEFK